VQVFIEAIYEGALYIVLELEPLSSRPLVDRRHLLDLMLVDRMFKSRFDSLESERENRYRHPHCTIVTRIGVKNRESIQEKRGASREYCMKNTHVQAFELIEGSFDSSTWFCCFLCILMLCSGMFAFLLCICFVYAVHVISCFKLKSERERE
jgi:hypothetical protein